MSTLQTNILDIKLENPFLLASAPPTATVEGIENGFRAGWAGAVLKTITPDNLILEEASPRYAALKDNGRIVGFQNIELLSHQKVSYWIDAINYLKEKYPSKVIIASIMASTKKEEWQELVKILNETQLDAYELNFSCPHGMPEKNIGMAIGTSPDISKLITSWVKEVATRPVFVKLSPNVTNISLIAKSVEEAGADGLSAINTVQGFMGLNLDTLEPNLSIVGKTTFGGCSGKMVLPIGLRCVAEMRKVSSLPILGIGGISTFEDALQYIFVGSDAVQICTEVMLNGYDVIHKLKDNLLNYLSNKNINSLSELKNIAISKITSHEKLNKKTKVYPFINKSKCAKCLKCVNICSECEAGALSKKENEIVLDKEKCLGCSLCSHICNAKAVQMCG